MIMGVIAGFLGVYLKIRDQTKQRVKLQRNPIIIGLLVSIMSGLILNLYTEWGFYLGILFGTTVVGYTVAKNYENGIKHGVIVGVVTILIFGIATTILAGTLFGVGTAVLLVLLTISEVIISGIIGSIGGTIGVVIKERWLKPVPAM
jgi:predicted Na+-dependent transporter